MVKSFDNLARIYQPLEYLALGRSLERARFCLLRHLEEADTTLLLGEGDGRLLQTLLRARTGGTFHVVERSPEMVAVARRRIHEDPRVSFHVGDAREGLPAGPFDAVVTPFFLDCFDPLDQSRLIRSVASQLVPGATWLYVDFVGGGHGWRRAHRRAWLSVLYAAFRATTDIAAEGWTDPVPLLRGAGLQATHRTDFRGGLLTAQLWRAPR